MTTDSAPGINPANQPDFELGRLKVRPSRNEVEQDGAVELVEPRVMRLLVALASRRGAVVSREQLVEAGWGARPVGGDAINRCLAQVRRLGMAYGAFVLETAPRIGFRLILLPSAAPAKGRSLGWKENLAYAAAAVVVVGMLAFSSWWILRPRPAGGLNQDSPVAVAPFRVAGEDPAARAMAASVPGLINGALTGSGVRIVKTGARGPRLEIDGVVRAEAETLMTHVRLRDPRNGVVMWSSDFSAPKAQAASLSQEAAWRSDEVIQMIHDDARYATRDLDEPTLGLFVQTTDSVRQSGWTGVAAMREVVRRAPNFAPGHVEMAKGLAALAATAADEQAPHLLAESAAEARTAQDLAPHSSIAWAASLPAMDGRQWAERKRIVGQVQRFWEGETAAPTTAQFLLDSGRLDDGLLLAKRGVAAADGAYPMPRGQLVNARYLAGEDKDAKADIDRFLSMKPGDNNLRRAKLMMTLLSSDPNAALAILDDPARRPLPLDAVGDAALRAFIQARTSGSATDARAASAAIQTASKSGALGAGDAASLLVALGDKDGALSVLEAYAGNPRTTRPAIFFEPRFLFGRDLAPLRENPRFIGVVDRLGLLSYWRSSGHWPDFCRTEPRSVCGMMKR